MMGIVSSAEDVKMWIEVFSGTCVIYRENRTLEEPRDNPSPMEGFIMVSGSFYIISFNLIFDHAECIFRCLCHGYFMGTQYRPLGHEVHLQVW